MKKVIVSVCCLMLIGLMSRNADALFYGFEDPTLPPEFIVTGSPGPVGPITLRSHDGSQSLNIGTNNPGSNGTTVSLVLAKPLSSGDISWYQYDEFGRWSPYYMFITINSQDDNNILGLSLYDYGWNYVYDGLASTLLVINDAYTYYNGPLRVAGSWSKYEMIFANDKQDLYVNDAFIGSYGMFGREVSKLNFNIGNYFYNSSPNQFQIDSLSITDTSQTSVPEPSTSLLLGAGIGGLALLRRKACKM